jgi:hypothetical protein
MAPAWFLKAKIELGMFGNFALNGHMPDRSMLNSEVFPIKVYMVN